MRSLLPFSLSMPEPGLNCLALRHLCGLRVFAFALCARGRSTTSQTRSFSFSAVDHGTIEPQRRKGRKENAKFVTLIELAKRDVNDVRLTWGRHQRVSGVFETRGARRSAERFHGAHRMNDWATPACRRWLHASIKKPPVSRHPERGLLPESKDPPTHRSASSRATRH